MELQQPLPADPDALEAIFHKTIKDLQDMPPDKSRANQTLYEIIKSNAEATIFCSNLEKHTNLLSLLQDPSSGEHTVLLPLDNHWKLDDEFMHRIRDDEDYGQQVLSSHISPHYVATDTFPQFSNIPTILRPTQANGPQIIRTQRSSTFEFNNSAKLTRGNIIAKNGIIHQINRVLIPPPDSLRVIQSRSELGRFNQAIHVLSLSDELAAPHIKGRTIFAPNDAAFEALGDEVLGFLFETNLGHSYLKALLKYHVCPDITFYTNMMWPKNDIGARLTSKDKLRIYKGKQVQSISTMAIDVAHPRTATIAVQIARYNDLFAVTVNDTSHVVIQDIMANDGVVHVVDAIIVPTAEERNIAITTGTDASTKLTLQQLKGLLAPFIEAI